MAPYCRVLLVSRVQTDYDPFALLVVLVHGRAAHMTSAWLAIVRRTSPGRCRRWRTADACALRRSRTGRGDGRTVVSGPLCTDDRYAGDHDGPGYLKIGNGHGGQRVLLCLRLGASAGRLAGRPDRSAPGAIALRQCLVAGRSRHGRQPHAQATRHRTNAAWFGTGWRLSDRRRPDQKVGAVRRARLGERRRDDGWSRRQLPVEFADSVLDGADEMACQVRHVGWR